MVANKKAVSALKQHKAEQEEENHHKIVQALERIRTGKTEKISLKRLGKVTVNQLANEADVSRASLYGNHSVFLHDLAKLNEKRTIGVNAKRKEREQKGETGKEVIRNLTLAKNLLAQENFRLNEENKKLKRDMEALISQLSSKSNVASITQNKN